MNGTCGAIILFPTAHGVPTNWLPCDGAAVQLVMFQELYAVIGTSFGGNGMSYFNVPRLTSPAAGMQYLICANGTYPTFSTTGATGGTGTLNKENA